jgi:hypothetical protein
VAELRERGVALMASDQHIPAALVGSYAHRRQLTEQRDRLRERVDLLGQDLLPDVLVVTDLAERDHLCAGDRVPGGGHLALVRREALCCIPGAVGMNSKEGSWV